MLRDGDEAEGLARRGRPVPGRASEEAQGVALANRPGRALFRLPREALRRDIRRFVEVFTLKCLSMPWMTSQ